MKKHKKILYLIALCTIIFSIIPGCNNQEKTSSEDMDSTENKNKVQFRFEKYNLIEILEKHNIKFETN